MHTHLHTHIYTYKIIPFADDLVLMVEAESVGEAENFANIELKLISGRRKIKLN